MFKFHGCLVILSKQYGIKKDRLVVTVNGGSLYIKKIIYNKKNIIEKIKPGDIFIPNTIETIFQVEEIFCKK